MTQRNRILKTLSVILPAGAFGASVLLALASSDAKAATNAPTALQTTAGASVSTRLLEIRDGISNLSGSASDGDRWATRDCFVLLVRPSTRQSNPGTPTPRRSVTPVARLGGLRRRGVRARGALAVPSPPSCSAARAAVPPQTRVALDGRPRRGE